MTTRQSLSNVNRLAIAAVVAVTSASCGSELMRTGRAPVFLTITQIEAAKGDDPSTFVASLLSDVQTIVEQQIGGVTVQVPTIFNDLGRATIRVDLKDQGFVLAQGGTAITTPIQSVTITRYRVSFRRADGRNTPGVDVPFGFDGATTATIPVGSSAGVVFDLVRHANKSEPPLANLIGGGGSIFISTVAEITFFGRDQNGNEVTVTGLMDVTFADFGDSE
ncbi:MAG TPA: hypothetical protein VJ691_12030 [Vicinamibacterales bacterium]|nr:hypothetical protein [Vicinamibacterales bacterium]